MRGIKIEPRLPVYKKDEALALVLRSQAFADSEKMAVVLIKRRRSTLHELHD
jgi:hypothetical protein